MALVNLEELIDSGVHFGHRASRWHPKMARYIFGKRNLIHIIDVRETIKGLVRASNFLQNFAKPHYLVPTRSWRGPATRAT